MTTLTEQEVLDVLHAIERGEVTLDPEDVQAARGVYNLCTSFRLSNGWLLTAFVDCGEWDYLDSAVSPDGRSLTYDEMPGLEDYRPEDPTKWGLR